jgi:hypothetical protein
MLSVANKPFMLSVIIQNVVVPSQARKAMNNYDRPITQQMPAPFPG